MNNLDDIDVEGDQPAKYNRRRLDVEWATLVAIREMLGISLKGRTTPTYEQSLAFARALAPMLFDSDQTLIGTTGEPQLVEEYRQKTEALSQLESREVPPTEIIDKDINDLNNLLEAESTTYLLRKRLGVLQNTRMRLRPKKYTENQLILRDLFKAQRNIPVPPIEGDTYREFRLTEDRGLRIRLLHPDQPEHRTGADLIYEHYWDKKKRMRIAVIQYKIWNARTLYSSQAKNLENQLDTLKTVFCDRGFCQASDSSKRQDAYRLPFCLAFLRPTDELQNRDSRLISSGLHIPVCVIKRLWQETAAGNKKIESRRIRSESLTHRVFEEVLNTNILGSRLFTYDEIEDLYKKHKILESAESVVLHVQEFDV